MCEFHLGSGQFELNGYGDRDRDRYRECYGHPVFVYGCCDEGKCVKYVRVRGRSCWGADVVERHREENAFASIYSFGNSSRGINVEVI